MSRLYSLVLSMVLLLAGAASPSALPEQPDAETLLKVGRTDEALRLLTLQVQREPENAAAYNLLCRAYFQLEQWDASLRMAEKSIALEPHNSLYHQWAGRAAGRKAENSNPFAAFTLARRVKAEFERAVALDGGNLSARSDLTEYYLEAPAFLGGDKNKARQQAQAVAPHDPAMADYLYAKVEEKQGLDHAEQQYKKAITTSDNSARYWVELAYYYRRAGRSQDMETAVVRSLTAAHHDGMSAYDGAFLLLRTGRNFPAAIQMLRLYLEGPDLSEEGPAFRARHFLGELLEKQGDRQHAAEEFRAALALAPEYRPSRDALARISR